MCMRDGARVYSPAPDITIICNNDNGLKKKHFCGRYGKKK